MRRGDWAKKFMQAWWDCGELPDQRALKQQHPLGTTLFEHLFVRIPLKQYFHLTFINNNRGTDWAQGMVRYPFCLWNEMEMNVTYPVFVDHFMRTSEETRRNHYANVAHMLNIAIPPD